MLAHGRIARERRHDERESRLPIGILETVRAASCRIGVRVGHVAHREIEREIGLVGLGERQARRSSRRAARPARATRSSPASWRRSAARRTTPLSSARRSGARRGRRAASASSLGASAGRSSAARESPEHRARVVEHLADVQLVGLLRQRGESTSHQLRRRDLALEHRLPQRRRAPRRASADRESSGSDALRYSSVAGSSIEVAVAQSAAGRQNPVRRRQSRGAFDQRSAVRRARRRTTRSPADAVGRAPEPLGPDKLASARIALTQREAIAPCRSDISSSVVIVGRPGSSTHAWLHAARSTGVRASSSAIKSVHVALPKRVRLAGTRAVRRETYRRRRAARAGA